ncbi:MAG: enoyl-CoA hydratase/isomerase family protein [Pseudomonadota bacterium]
MADIIIRTDGFAGLITLNRPDALNALTWQMLLEIETALDRWRGDPTVKVVMIDGAGDRAFCAGGDIAEMYASGLRRDYDYGRRFWRDEYRLNAKMTRYPKPIVTFLHGFTMGGGVGVGCHASHRIVCEGSRIAMPECGIGLVPDVGGSLLLARAPDGVGPFLGLTGDRMDAGDAIYTGFADTYIDKEAWPALIADLKGQGDINVVAKAGQTPTHCRLSDWQDELATLFGSATRQDLIDKLANAAGPAAETARKAFGRNAPLAMAVGWAILQRIGPETTIEEALDLEFRYTHRAMAQGDFLEGIRAAIIDRDKAPKWQHESLAEVTEDEVAAMLAPMGADALKWEE